MFNFTDCILLQVTQQNTPLNQILYTMKFKIILIVIVVKKHHFSIYIN